MLLFVASRYRPMEQKTALLSHFWPNVAVSGMESRNTIDANWAKDEDSAFTNLYLDLQLIPTRRFRLAQPKDPKGV